MMSSDLIELTDILYLVVKCPLSALKRFGGKTSKLVSVTTITDQSVLIGS